MPLSIYPPILQSTQPAFLASLATYKVKFTLQKVTSPASVKHIQIRVVEQRSNSSIVNTTKYPDNVIYKNVTLDPDATSYEIDILNSQTDDSDLRIPWSAGSYYKIQLRFGMTEFPSDLSTFASWKKEQINSQTFSEWSTVMIIKAIAEPRIYIENAGATRTDVISSKQTEPTLTPQFVAGYEDNTPEGKTAELLDQYKFDLYDESGETLIESSDWIQHTENTRPIHRFKTVLTNNNSYKVVFSIVTENGYTTSTTYEFQAVKVYLDAIEGVTFKVDDSSAYCKENGCLRIYITAEEPLSGCYVLTRTSELSNYNVYEDLRYFNYFEQEFDNDLLYTDFLVESGIKYKYAFQYQNSQGLRSNLLQESGTPVPARHIDFEHSYIYRDGVQLRLSLNQKLSSFKHTTLTNKQDTLGDKYPYLAKSGYAYYAEFPISGTISMHMDEDQTFFSLDESGYVYDNETVIPVDKFVGFEEDRSGRRIENKLNYSSSISADNVFIERKFREKVEEFLNDFTYKLYKSPTEGNIVIGLTSVSMTPNANLGRMIFDFSATAYEVMENTLENLDSVGITEIGAFSEDLSNELTQNFGQIAGVYSGSADGDNIYELIKKQEEIIVGDGKYKLSLQNIDSFWVERYPQIDFDGELYELNAKRNQEEEEGKDTTETELAIAKCEALKAAAQNSPSAAVRLTVNGKEIVVAPNRLYSLREPVTSLSLRQVKYPIIINYVCTLARIKNDSVGEVKTIEVSRIWGQVSGIFTGTDKILRNYRYYYGKGEPPYRVYSGDKTIEEDKLGRVLVDDTNYNVYKTVNLYDIIEEETRKQVEYIYNIQGGFVQDSEGVWNNGTIYYAFSDITEFDIEASPNTVLYIGTKKDGSDKTPVMIGPTGRYTLNPMDGMIRYIALLQPQYALINYKCLTTQTTRSF